MTIQMYDLAAADPSIRFSPYCWRIRMALAHKGLPVETIPWRFRDKDKIAFSGQGFVPVIRDGDRVVHDSWDIAEYLDATYPRKPLMDGAQGKALANFVRHWAQNVVSATVFKAVIGDIHAIIDEGDKAYFRESREKRLGKTLEDFAITPEAAMADLRVALSPLRATLQTQAFIHGASPAFGDYVLFGVFMWARGVSKIALLAQDDPVHAWRERMLDLYDGLARKAPGAGA